VSTEDEQASPEVVHNGWMPRATCSRLTLAARAALVALSAALAACESADERCARLRGEADKTWAQYAQALQQELDAARNTRDGAKSKLEGPVHERHEREAQQHAEQLHGAEKSSAWYRTFLAAEQAQCSKDPECLELKVQVTQAEEQLADLTPRLEAVRAAQRAANGEAEAARRAAEAVPSDEQRAVSLPARAASAEAISACAKNAE
jgi:chromosome segregation ATPase